VLEEVVSWENLETVSVCDSMTRVERCPGI